MKRRKELSSFVCRAGSRIWTSCVLSLKYNHKSFDLLGSKSIFFKKKTYLVNFNTYTLHPPYFCEGFNLNEKVYEDLKDWSDWLGKKIFSWFLFYFWIHDLQLCVILSIWENSVFKSDQILPSFMMVLDGYIASRLSIKSVFSPYICRLPLALIFYQRQCTLKIEQFACSSGMPSLYF